MSIPAIAILVVVFSGIILKVYNSPVPWYYKDNIGEIIIGFLVLIFSIWNSCESSDSSDRLGKQNDTTHLKIDNLRDSIKNLKDTFLTIGLGIDEKTNKILVLDSQLLKQSVSKIINYNFTSFTTYNQSPTQNKTETPQSNNSVYNTVKRRHPSKQLLINLCNAIPDTLSKIKFIVPPADKESVYYTGEISGFMREVGYKNISISAYPAIVLDSVRVQKTGEEYRVYIPSAQVMIN